MFFVEYVKGSAHGALVSAASVMTAFSVAWALGERRLRHQKVAYMQERIKKLELRLDPARTSSLLTIEGKTNPLDR
jgi:hypothetical protein